MFNSQITADNSPINAIRRVVAKKKKPAMRVPGITGPIEEDVEGEEDYSEEEAGEEQMTPGQKLELERVEAQQSSAEGSNDEVDDKAKKIDMKFSKKEEAMEEKDSKKKKEKEKKDKKKAKENPGYDKEEVEKGKKLMSNANFRNNLEKLRSKFKDSGKGGVEESPNPQHKKSPLVPPRQDMVYEPERSMPKEQVHEYGANSEVILGDKGPRLDNGTRQQMIGSNTKGLKDLSKNKPITPNVKFDSVNSVSEKTANTSKEPREPKEPKEPERIQIKSTTNSQTSKPKEQKINENTSTPVTEISTKPRIKDQSDQDRAYNEEWSLNVNNAGAPKIKTTSPVMTKLKGLEKPKVQEDAPNLKRKKRNGGDDSDNSWDEDKNPFD